MGIFRRFIVEDRYGRQE